MFTRKIRFVVQLMLCIKVNSMLRSANKRKMLFILTFSILFLADSSISEPTKGISTINNSSSSARLADASAESILKIIDNYRMPYDSAEMETNIKTFNGNKLKKDLDYEIYVKASGQSLVVSKSSREKGQKFLMNNGDYWLFLPKTKRAIRITPQQKLLGDASIGDVAQLAWSKDYNAQILKIGEFNNSSAILLELHSKEDSSTYEQIFLWINKNDYFPIEAELFLKSGKLAKIARYFSNESSETDKRVYKVELLDKIMDGKKTVMSIETIKPREIPNKYFQSNYLLKSNTL